MKMSNSEQTSIIINTIEIISSAMRKGIYKLKKNTVEKRIKKK